MAEIYQPKVTVVMPVYNGEKYVGKAIESALNQTYKNIEIIVVNDGSTDNTDDAVKPYLDRVSFYKKENGGVSSALNLAISKASGVWISWLSHDDLYAPQKIEKQINRLNEILGENPGCDIEKYVLSCGDCRIDENGERLPRGGTSHPSYTDCYDLVAKEIINYSIGGCTVLAPKSAYDSVGGFDEGNRTISDADMWFRLMLSGYIFDFSNEPLVLARYHKDMVSVKRKGLVDKEKQAFYINSIKAVAPHISDGQKCEIAVSMTKMSLDAAADVALESIKTIGFSVKLEIFQAKIYRLIKGVLRTVYRKIKWG